MPINILSNLLNKSNCPQNIIKQLSILSSQYKKQVSVYVTEIQVTWLWISRLIALIKDLTGLAQ